MGVAVGLVIATPSNAARMMHLDDDPPTGGGGGGGDPVLEETPGGGGGSGVPGFSDLGFIRESWGNAKLSLCLSEGPGPTGSLWEIEGLSGLPVAGQSFVLGGWSGGAEFKVSSAFQGDLSQFGSAISSTMSTSVVTGILLNECGIGYATLVLVRLTCEQGAQPKTFASLLGYSGSPELVSIATANHQAAALAANTPPPPAGTPDPTTPGGVTTPTYPQQEYDDAVVRCQAEAQKRLDDCVKSYEDSMRIANVTTGVGIGFTIGIVGSIFLAGAATVLTCGAAAPVAGALIAGGVGTAVYGAKKAVDYGQLIDTAKYRHSVAKRCCEETMEDWKRNNQNPSQFRYPYKECEFMCPDPS